MGDEAEQHRREQTERAEYHAAANRRRAAEESAKAQVLIDRFVLRAREIGLPTEELTARPYSGSGRYRTGVIGWFLRRTGSVGVDTDGRFYVLNVAPVPLGRCRRVRIDPSQPTLVVCCCCGDGDTFALDEMLEMRLRF